MANRPYTDEDLRAEAARQHATLIEDPDYVGVGEQMEGRRIPSTDDGLGGMGWDGLSNEHYDAAQRAIHNLITGAADVSDWAVELGADGLEPEEHQITLGADDKPIARIHFAFEPDMPDSMRASLVQGIGEAIGGALDTDESEELDENGDSDSDVFELISEIASRLRDATDEGEYHAVGLVADLANGVTTVADARAALAEIEFRHV